jgi:outer membrane protein OmpA-like peptidoglycan-associated protein
MNKKLMLLAAVAMVAQANAQSYLGYYHDNYAGVHSAIYNPSSIVDSRFRTDINLISASGFVGNDMYGFGISEAIKSLKDKSNKSFKELSTLNPKDFYNLAANVDILGPSFMFNIAPKHSVAISSRGRFLTNINEIDADLVNGFEDKSFELKNKQNFQLTTNAWVELGLTYATVLMDKNEHFLKGGLTLKYLSGYANNGLMARDFGVRYNYNATTPSASLIQSTGNLVARDLDSDNFTSFSTKAKGVGVGGDIGFTYEYRPEFKSHTYLDENNKKQYRKDENKYLLRAGLSITDLGVIGYKDQLESTYDVNLSYTDLQRKNTNFNQLYRKIKETKGDNFYLPTALHLNADYCVSRSWYVNANADLALTSGKNNTAKIENMYQLTPRFERSWFGAYLPISYLPISGFQAGFGLRVGPVFVGSGSLINNAFSKNSKAIDVHLGLKVPVFQSRVKDIDDDGVYDQDDRCPNISGPKANQGCPWEDTDKDGMLDKEDACPKVAGPQDNQGCPWPDADNDSVLDKDDACPQQAGAPENKGCPWPDTDNDGVLDKDDACPKEAGLKTNKGCPKVAEALPTPDVKILKKLNEYSKSVLFDNGKATIQTVSHADLDALAQLIKNYPDSRFSIEGHTDNVGQEAKNKQLSEDRAQAIKAYLVNKGIADTSLNALGFGSKKPLVKNNSAKNKALNRRVEIKVMP